MTSFAADHTVKCERRDTQALVVSIPVSNGVVCETNAITKEIARHFPANTNAEFRCGLDRSEVTL